jgi:ribosomal protein L17
MSEPQKDEFADLSGAQEDTVRQARKWVQSMVSKAKKSDLHLQMIAIEMMTQGLVILTGTDIEKARADVMAMFSEGEGGHLVLRQIQVRQSSESPE